MKTVYIVFENSWRGKFISAAFEDEQKAKAYLYEVRGEGGQCTDFLDSAYEYFMQAWEVK